MKQLYFKTGNKFFARLCAVTVGIFKKNMQCILRGYKPKLYLFLTFWAKQPQRFITIILRVKQSYFKLNLNKYTFIEVHLVWNLLLQSWFIKWKQKWKLKVLFCFCKQENAVALFSSTQHFWSNSVNLPGMLKIWKYV